MRSAARYALLVGVPTAAALLIYLRRKRAFVREPTSKQVVAQLTLCQPCEDSSETVAASPTPGTSQGINHVTPRRALIANERQVGLSKDSDSTKRRDHYIDWPDYFMSVAMLSAYRSKDPSRQVGACIVDPRTQRIVGIGYNGFPWGCSDDELPWARSASHWLDTKYPYVCHAEMNAIFNKNCSSLEGCRIYTTLFPCNECAAPKHKCLVRQVPWSR